MKKRVASALAVLMICLGAWGATAEAGQSHIVAPLQTHSCGYGSPHSTPGGVKCLGPGEYCSHKPGYAAAYHRAGFRCNSSGRLEYD